MSDAPTEIRRDIFAGLDSLLLEVRGQVLRAEGLHAPINSAHEGYAVILEELDELWDQVKLKRGDRDADAMRRELIQTAAMCLRTIRDVIAGSESPR